MLIQTSSPVHVPVMVLAKLRVDSFLEAVDPEGDPWGPPIIADIVDAFSLRGPQDAFEGVRNSRFTGRRKTMTIPCVFLVPR